MLIELIDHRAPELLLEQLKQALQAGISWGGLYFACLRLDLVLKESLPLTLQPVLEGRKSCLYFFADGSAFIAFSSPQKSVLAGLTGKFYSHFQWPDALEIHRYLDFQANCEELRLLCQTKILSNNNTSSDILIAEPKNSMHQPSLTITDSEQERLFQAAVARRADRKGLEIAIVEDQAFSAKLLMSLLQRLCRVFDTRNAEDAWKIYLQHAPDIVFLDIELPSASGHQLAAAIHALDPDAFIVMVTANHKAEDVARAKHNGVRGFVVKPYNKKKILTNIETYIHKKKPSL